VVRHVCHDELTRLQAAVTQDEPVPPPLGPRRLGLAEGTRCYMHACSRDLRTLPPPANRFGPPHQRNQRRPAREPRRAMRGVPRPGRCQRSQTPIVLVALREVGFVEWDLHALGGAPGGPKPSTEATSTASTTSDSSGSMGSPHVGQIARGLSLTTSDAIGVARDTPLPHLRHIEEEHAHRRSGKPRIDSSAPIAPQVLRSLMM
jgi:hypothetical protein